MMYQAFAAIFIAQAFGVHMPLSQQIFMLLILSVCGRETDSPLEGAGFEISVPGRDCSMAI